MVKKKSKKVKALALELEKFQGKDVTVFLVHPIPQKSPWGVCVQVTTTGIVIYGTRRGRAVNSFYPWGSVDYVECLPEHKKKIKRKKKEIEEEEELEEEEVEEDEEEVEEDGEEEEDEDEEEEDEDEDEEEEDEEE